MAEIEDGPLFTEAELHNLRAIKLVTGEDIIAVILQATDDVLQLVRPCRVGRIQRDDGNISLVLAKWQMLTEDPIINLSMGSVMCLSKVTKKIEDFYVRIVGQQIEEESIENNTAEYKWPDHLDEILKDKSKLN